MSKIKQFEIANYKALKGEHTFTPDGQSFYLIASNGQGKTSAARALIDFITKNAPSQPVTEGEKEGYIKVTLTTGEVIHVKFDDKTKYPRIHIITENGSFNAPKDVLQKLAGDGMTFNIDEFLTAQPKPRREMLTRIVGIDLDKYDTKEQELMEQRTLLNRQYKEQLSRVEPFDKSLVGAEQMDVSAISSELEDAIDRKHQVETVIDRMNEANKKVLTIEKRIEELEKEMSELNDYVESANQWLDENPIDADTIDDLKQSIRTAEIRNSAIKDAERLSKEYERAEALKFEADEINNKIHQVRQDKEAAIKKQPLPAEGLEFTPDGNITLDGLPFENEQIATSRKVIAGLQLASALLGQIRYLHIDGAVLDKNSTLKIAKWAAENDLQLAIERPTWNEHDLQFELIEKL